MHTAEIQSTHKSVRLNKCLLLYIHSGWISASLFIMYKPGKLNNHAMSKIHIVINVCIKSRWSYGGKGAWKKGWQGAKPKGGRGEQKAGKEGAKEPRSQNPKQPKTQNPKVAKTPKKPKPTKDQMPMLAQTVSHVILIIEYSK